MVDQIPKEQTQTQIDAQNLCGVTISRHSSKVWLSYSCHSTTCSRHLSYWFHITTNRTSGFELTMVGLWSPIWMPNQESATRGRDMKKVININWPLFCKIGLPTCICSGERGIHWLWWAKHGKGSPRDDHNQELRYLQDSFCLLLSWQLSCARLVPSAGLGYGCQQSSGSHL